MRWLDGVNDWVQESAVGKYFHLKERGSNLTTEIRAGIVTFLTSASPGLQRQAPCLSCLSCPPLVRVTSPSLCISPPLPLAPSLPPRAPAPPPSPKASYILAVNSSILADSGGTCSDADCTGPKAGTPGCRFTDPGFQLCVVGLAGRAEGRAD